MGLTNKLNEIVKEVDVIIAGGGTAACVVAGRLAEADPGLSILVIEGGQDNYNVPNVVNPLLFYQHLLPNSKTALRYKAKSSEHLAGRESIVPSGGTLGGGSSINFMMYTRAQRDDFNSWNTPGWTADDILPFMKKLETYHGPGNRDRHGYSGPIHISNGGYSAKSPEDDYIEVLESYGLPESKDMQSLDANNCCERSLRYVSPEGKRQDSAHTFLHPKLQDGEHPNLHVLTETKIVRVLFDENKTACGVEVTPNPDFQLEIGVTKHPKQVIRARKMVVVSCGANGSPSVLERSGIGNKDVLEKAGVTVVADLPGVGSNWQDHHLILLPFKTSLGPRETSDFLISGRVPVEDLLSSKDKILGWNYVEVGVKMQPSESDRATFDKDLLSAWEKDFKDKPNKPLMLMAIINGFVGDQSALEPGQYVLMANYTGYPYSRGSIHITGPNIEDPLDFDVGFFSDTGDVDLKKQVWAYKKQREFMRRTKMYRGEVALGHPRFPAGSKAALAEDVPDTGLDATDIQDLEYSAEDNKAIEQFLRENIQTTWHSLGSCKMAPRDDMGVVDANLSVHGVQGLKVIDLSIPPQNVGANTNNTALVIGEKGADIIINELSLPKE
ncbi:Alcohol oxidase [Cytospora mali]|uniref:Alcohol oxidase n=1 Tax=Cytospora mali TaxID=578113 RepID=A0A194VFK1_CYTMA|nr:Alcohol oxidase [Valsa mali var. pyri (nom. inval.)]